MAVPGTWLSSDALVSFGWPASSDSLVAELSFTTKVQLASWRPGASRLAIAVLRPQQSPASLVIGQYAPLASPRPEPRHDQSRTPYRRRRLPSTVGPDATGPRTSPRGQL